MLYRKSIMEKMQSPDQLDQVQEITKPMNIFIVIGGIVCIAASVLYFLMWV